MQNTSKIIFLLIAFLLSTPLRAQWINFTDATNTWLSSVSNDSEEKDMSTGDFNKDGRTDVIIVRKNPFSNMGAKTDILLINTGTTLQNMTATYAPEFLTAPTDARDVIVADFDNDTWEDIVVVSTFEDQPRYYRNKGNDTSGVWQGFVNESNLRFPLPLNVNPLQFCAGWAGDVTGNGARDIYMSNYATSGGCDDVLLINDGNGYFTDESQARLGSRRRSAFGTSVEIYDMDNDGDNDIVKTSTLYGVLPWNDVGVFILFNDGTGNFPKFSKAQSGAPYMFTIADFNKNGKKDIYVVDDAQDYVNYTTNINIDQFLNFNVSLITDPRSMQFGGNVKTADLDNDGDLDLGLADVDVDIPPCESGGSNLRKFTMMRNNNGTLTAPYGNTKYPWNESTYDFVFIDVNNDCHIDVLVGKCSEYRLFLNTGNAAGTGFVQISGDSMLCYGDTTVLNAGTGFESYLWSNGDTTQTTVITDSGAYYVIATDSLGCSVSDSIDVIVYDSVVVNITGPSGVCTSDTVVLEATAGFTSYVWSQGDTSSSITVMQGGNYCVTVTDANGCIDSTCFFLSQFGTPKPVISGPTGICTGDTALLQTDSGFTQYLWSTGESTSAITTSIPSLYCVTVIDNNGCSGDTCFMLNSFSEPAVTITTADTTLCYRDSAVLNAGSGFSTYAWSTGDTTQAVVVRNSGEYCVVISDSFGCEASDCIEIIKHDSVGVEIMGPAGVCVNDSIILEATTGFTNYLWSSGDDSDNITVTQGGTYCVTVTDVNGCSADACFFVSQFDQPQPTIDGPLNVCMGDTAFLQADSGYIQYFWSTGNSTSSITTSIPGTYCVTVTDNNGCLGDTCFVLNNFPQPVFNIEGPDTFCQGNPATLYCSDSFYTEYRWNTGAAMQSITVFTGGTYCLEVTDTNGCKSNTVCHTLTMLSPTVHISADTIFCEGDTTYLVANSGFASYVWAGTAVSDSVLSVTSAGEYCVLVNDAFGCQDVDCIEIMADSSVSVEVTDIIDICQGDTAIVTAMATGTQSFLWSTGDTTESILVHTPGQYCVIVTSAFGCTFSDCGIASILVPPIALFEVQSCGPTVAMIFNHEIPIDSSGVDTLIFEGKNGDCDTVIVINATISPEIVLTDTIIVDDDGNGTGSIKVTVSGGTPPFMYSWDNGGLTDSIGGLSMGMYNLVVTDQNGCTGSWTFEVEEIVHVNHIFNTKNIIVRPNPFSAQFEIIVPENITGVKTARLYSSSGQLMKELEFTGEQAIVHMPQSNGFCILALEVGGEVIGRILVAGE